MIGDTQDAAEQHYGTAERIYRDVKGRIGHIYRTPAFLIMVQYFDGVSHSEVYAKQHDEAFAQPELDAVMSANGSGGQWQKIPIPDSPSQVWAILQTGSFCAYGPSVIYDRQFRHAVSVSTNAYVQHNKALDRQRAQ